ncbi:unnamed protein product [Nyctereutes procyonoides]|uniref:(raccoon dog) hypothetical protein n=1 Tax=Nyctereutes procyonoides TaxID=34880 RepID=A0A811ZG77_NYCPR|nr:unnamed protein product [Nyctereutes procyonoides]
MGGPEGLQGTPLPGDAPPAPQCRTQEPDPAEPRPAGRPQEPLMPPEVHQNHTLRDLYLKELRTHKLSTEYHVNPLCQVHTITRKPMSWQENLEEPAGARFLNLIHHALWGHGRNTQTRKQKASRERDDRRLNHVRVHSGITLYKATVWSLGEDDRHT